MNVPGGVGDQSAGLVVRLERDVGRHRVGREVGDRNRVAVWIGGHRGDAVRKDRQRSPADGRRRIGGRHRGVEVRGVERHAPGEDPPVGASVDDAPPAAPPVPRTPLPAAPPVPRTPLPAAAPPVALIPGVGVEGTPASATLTPGAGVLHAPEAAARPRTSAALRRRTLRGEEKGAVSMAELLTEGCTLSSHLVSPGQRNRVRYLVSAASDSTRREVFPTGPGVRTGWRRCAASAYFSVSRWDPCPPLRARRVNVARAFAPLC